MSGLMKVCVLIAFVACGESASQSSAIRDPQWAVADEPSLVIGGDDEADPLHRVVGATRIGRGYLVANQGSSELRFYNETGELTTRIGRDGAGPGEFRSVRIAGRLPGDSIVVFDAGNRRLSVICDGSRVCQEIPLVGLGRVVGVSSDRFLLEEILPTERNLGVSSDRHVFLAVDREQQHVDTLLSLDGQPRQVGGSDNVRWVMPIFLTSPPLVAAFDDGFVIANGRDAVLEFFHARNMTHRPVQLPIPIQSISADEFSEAVEAFLELAGSTLPPEARQVVDAMEAPAARPPFRRMRFDSTGLLWLELDDGSTVNRTWLITDAGGSTRARVSMPSGFELLDAGEEHVVGLWRDSLGVEVIRVHALVRR